MDMLFDLVFPELFLIVAVLVGFVIVLRYLQRNKDEHGTLLPEDSRVMRTVALPAGVLALAFAFFMLTQPHIQVEMLAVFIIGGMGLPGYALTIRRS